MYLLSGVNNLCRIVFSKVFTEFVTILLLLYVLSFCGMLDLSSPDRDQLCTSCPGGRSVNHWTAKDVPMQTFKKKNYLTGFSCSTQDLQSSLQHVKSFSWSMQDLWLQHANPLIVAFGIQFPNQGPNLGPLHWESGVLATGPAGKASENLYFFNELLNCSGSSLLCAGFLQLCPSEATLVAVRGLLIAVASLVMKHRPQGVRASVLVVHLLSCSAPCGIFPEQGSNLCSLHCQADS